MRRTLILLLVGGAGLMAGTTALADDHCDRPMRDWRPRQAVEERARELGLEVGRIRTDDGCYKIYGRTADGRSVEIEMDPVTLEVLRTRLSRSDEARRSPSASPRSGRDTGPDGRSFGSAIRPDERPHNIPSGDNG